MVTKSLTLTLLMVLFVTVSTCFGLSFNGRVYTQTSGQWYEVDAGNNYPLRGTEIWVNFATGTTQNQINNLNTALGGEVLVNGSSGTYLIQSTWSPQPDPLDFMASYLDTSIVVKGHNHCDGIWFWPNDPAVNADCAYTQRYLYRPDNDAFDNTINPGPAWDLERGDSLIKVGVLDNGLFFQHSELVGNVWQNLGEDADHDGHTLEVVNGAWALDPGDLNFDSLGHPIDDDGNGYPNDLIGWNVSNWGTHPNVGQSQGWSGEGYHGTPVSGIIAARSNNESQFAGIAVVGETPQVFLSSR